MVKNLSIKEIEDFVLSNQIIIRKLSKYKFLFDTYFLGKSVPGLQNASRRALIDFINLATQEDKDIISEILGREIKFPSFRVSQVKSFSTDIDFLENLIDDASNYNETILFRKGREVKVLLWR